MSIQDIFLAPGHLITQFIFALFAYPPEQADLVLYWVLTILASLFFWSKAIRIFTTLVKCLAGFGR